MTLCAFFSWLRYGYRRHRTIARIRLFIVPKVSPTRCRNERPTHGGLPAGLFWIGPLVDRQLWQPILPRGGRSLPRPKRPPRSPTPVDARGRLLEPQQTDKEKAHTHVARPFRRALFIVEKVSPRGSQYGILTPHKTLIHQALSLTLTSRVTAIGAVSMPLPANRRPHDAIGMQPVGKRCSSIARHRGTHKTADGIVLLGTLSSFS